MAIKAGRVGVRADQVDPYGRLKAGSSLENLTLSLDENAGGDPVINLEYDSGDEHYSSPVAFDKDDFELQNNHIKTKGGGGATTVVHFTIDLDTIVADLTVLEVLAAAKTGRVVAYANNQFLGDLIFYKYSALFLCGFCMNVTEFDGSGVYVRPYIHSNEIDEWQIN